MSYYKAGLAPVPRQMVVGASEKQSGPGLGTMVAAGLISGVVLLAISKQATSKAPKLTVSREAQAHRYAVARYKEKGLPWS